MTSWGPNRLDVFHIGSDSSLYHKWWNGSDWFPSASGNWENLGGNLIHDPAVVSWGPNRLDVFAMNTASNCQHKDWDGFGWEPGVSSWDNLLGGFLGKPTAVSWGASNRVTVFAIGNDYFAWSRTYNGAAWDSNWTRIGLLQLLYETVSAASWGGNRIDVVGVAATNAHIYHQFYNGNAWSGWKLIQQSGVTIPKIVGPPKLVSWGVNRLDLIAKQADGILYHMASGNGGGTWAVSATTHGRHPLGPILYDPEMVACVNEQLDVFVIGKDSSLWHRRFVGGSNWSAWENLGGSYKTTPKAVCRNSRALDVFVVGTDSAVYRRYWDGSTWESEYLGGISISTAA